MTEQKENNRFIRVFEWFGIFSVSLMVAVCLWIVYLQFFQKTKYCEEDEYETRELIPTRGSILSYDGKPLAESITYYDVHFDFAVPADSLVKKYFDPLADSLSALFKDKSADKYRHYMKECRDKKAKMRFVPIGNRKLTYIEARRLRTFPLFCLDGNVGGGIIKPYDIREHPYGSLARKVVGSINANGEGSGLEKSFDARLRGTEGAQKYQRLAGNRWIPVQGLRYTPAVDGTDIRTTIDITIQEAAEKALREQLMEASELEGGCVIVMDVKTGAVRALANLKREPNGKFTESYNYATGHATEPGSTLKLSCLLAILEDGYATLDTPVDGFNGVWHYGRANTPFSDTRAGGYGKMTVKTAFEHSSNVGFSQLAVRYYEKKPKEYLDRIHSMKLGEKLNLEIGEEAYSVFHTPGDGSWTDVTLPMMGIGYGVLLTPMHTLTFYNAVANDGRMMKPYLVEAFSKDGTDIEVFKPTVISASICSKKSIAEAKKALRGVVTDGTAKILDNEYYHISGKTGTAQIAFDNGGKVKVYRDAFGNRMHQASLAGFFPSENPRYSCIVVLYSGKTKGNFYGASWAGPVFKKVADKIYSIHPNWSAPLEPSDTQPSDTPVISAGRGAGLASALHSLAINTVTVPEKGVWLTASDRDTTGNGSLYPIHPESGVMPDVAGMGLRDAMCLLEREGYKVSVSGQGRIYGQSPAAGAAITAETTVELTLR